MSVAALVARAGGRALRAVVALHPREFRRRFGDAVLAETLADIHDAAPRGTAATVSTVARALIDALRGVAMERANAGARFGRAMHSMFASDLRHAIRTLLRAPRFTIIAVGTLGIGLALVVTVAVVVNAYLVRGLPFPGSTRLFEVRYGTPTTPFPTGMEKLDWRSLDDVIELPIAWDLDNFNLRGGTYPEVLQGTWVTPGYMDGFGVRPAQGRGFLPTDFEPGRPTVALISHRLWQTRFNGDPGIVGRTFDAYVNDRPDEVELFTIIGVLAPDHWHLNAFTEVLAPLRVPTYPYLVRLRDGVPAASVAERVTALVKAGTSGLPSDWRVELRSAHAAYVQQIRPLLLAVAIATGLVLLIACANVAVLLTVRATERRREIAVRQALGATGGSITRIAVAEPIVLGVTATACGVALAWGTIAAIAPVIDHYLGRPAPGGAGTLALDPSTALGAALVGVLAIVICAVVPLWVIRRTPVSLTLTTGQKGSTDGAAQRRARSVLIAIEVAACLTLLVGAGVTLQSAVRLLRVDMGLDTRDVLVGRFSLRQRSYPDAPARAAFYERVLSRTDELSTLRGMAFTTSWPLQQALTREVSNGRADAASSVPAGLVGVTADYFDTLTIAVHEGRTFTSSDRLGSEPVAVISRTLAARLWPSSSAVGQHLRIAPPANSPPSALPATRRVVGVVGDIRHAHTDTDLADVYIPLLQSPTSSVFVYLRVSPDTPTAEHDVRRLLASLDGDVGLSATRRLADILDLQRAGSRFLAYLLMVFAGFAAALALVGIFGVIAYTVRQREREIAVRLAIGADRAAITRMFVRQGAMVLAVGLALGIAGAWSLGSVLQAQLFAVDAADPALIGIITAAFAVCGLGAVAWPARAAAAMDPARALKD